MSAASDSVDEEICFFPLLARAIRGLCRDRALAAGGRLCVSADFMHKLRLWPFGMNGKWSTHEKEFTLTGSARLGKPTDMAPEKFIIKITSYRLQKNFICGIYPVICLDGHTFFAGLPFPARILAQGN
jgi:hypothetical protein